jgi:putative ATP-dependent endonuclease of OLD family
VWPEFWIIWHSRDLKVGLQRIKFFKKKLCDSTIMKMLIHFRRDFGVLHDCDWPYGKEGKLNKDGSLAKSGSWAHNMEIRKLVNLAKTIGLGVAHEVSIPDFERCISLPRGTAGKPFEAYLAIKQDEVIKKDVQALLQSPRLRPSFS